MEEKHPTIQEKLAAPFPPGELGHLLKSVRDGKRGLALSYIDARAAARRLDEVMGIGGWQDTYAKVTLGKQEGRECALSLLIDGEWVTKTDASPVTAVEPLKGAYSKAFVRAASKFGIGRYLYYLPARFVAVRDTGRKTRKGDPVYEIADKIKLPEWALPGGAGYPPDEEIEAPENLDIPDPIADDMPAKWSKDIKAEIKKAADEAIRVGAMTPEQVLRAYEKYEGDPQRILNGLLDTVINQEG